ncbi:MAG TPA: C39 family peptidase [Candidatus Limnocylindrales bacterium]|nr:C39 family peptidase [Candidatus Limnocylindrales bacterium]
MLRLIERPGHHAQVRVPPSSRAVVSWNTTAPSGGIALVAHRADGSVSEPLLFARWSPAERRSLDGADAISRIEVDVLRSDVPLTAVGVSSTVELDAVAVTVPPPPDARVARHARTAELDVPRLSQYFPEHPNERGWCSAASLAMLLRYHGVETDVLDVASGVFDTAYGGTGNWAFSMAYAGARGLRGAVAYLRGIDHVAAFVDAGLPVAISIGWNHGELPGAPLEHSAGHLLVVRGIERARVLVNDPAHPAIVAAYSRDALDLVFRNHGGVAYLVAPRERTAELVALANNAELAAAR